MRRAPTACPRRLPPRSKGHKVARREGGAGGRKLTVGAFFQSAPSARSADRQARWSIARRPRPACRSRGRPRAIEASRQRRPHGMPPCGRFLSQGGDGGRAASARRACVERARGRRLCTPCAKVPKRAHLGFKGTRKIAGSPQAGRKTEFCVQKSAAPRGLKDELKYERTFDQRLCQVVKNWPTTRGPEAQFPGPFRAQNSLFAPSLKPSSKLMGLGKAGLGANGNFCAGLCAGSAGFRRLRAAAAAAIPSCGCSCF